MQMAHQPKVNTIRDEQLAELTESFGVTYRKEYGWLSGTHVSAKGESGTMRIYVSNWHRRCTCSVRRKSFFYNGYLPYEEMERILPGFVVSYDGLELETKPL